MVHKQFKLFSLPILMRSLISLFCHVFFEKEMRWDGGYDTIGKLYRTDRKTGDMSESGRHSRRVQSPFSTGSSSFTSANEPNPHPFLGERKATKLWPFIARHVHLHPSPPLLYNHHHSRGHLTRSSRVAAQARASASWSVGRPVTRSASSGRFSSLSGSPAAASSRFIPSVFW